MISRLSSIISKLKIFMSPSILFLIALVIIIAYVFISKSNFIDTRRVFKDYFAIFNNEKSHLIVFWGTPLLFSAAVTQVAHIADNSCETIIVFLSILLSAFFAMLSILVSSKGTRTDDLYKQVLSETVSTTLLEIILCILSLIISMAIELVRTVLPTWLTWALSYIDFYFIFVMLINILILIKRIKSLIDNS